MCMVDSPIVEDTCNKLYQQHGDDGVKPTSEAREGVHIQCRERSAGLLRLTMYWIAEIGLPWQNSPAYKPLNIRNSLNLELSKRNKFTSTWHGVALLVACYEVDLLSLWEA